MLDPQPPPVASHADVVPWHDAASQPVLHGGEGRQETVSFRGGDEPYANLAVLVSCEDFPTVTAEGDGFDEA